MRGARPRSTPRPCSARSATPGPLGRRPPRAAHQEARREGRSVRRPDVESALPDRDEEGWRRPRPAPPAKPSTTGPRPFRAGSAGRCCATSTSPGSMTSTSASTTRGPDQPRPTPSALGSSGVPTARDLEPILSNDLVEVPRGVAAKVARVFTGLHERGLDRENAQRSPLHSVVAMFSEAFGLQPGTSSPAGKR